MVYSLPPSKAVRTSLSPATTGEESPLGAETFPVTFLSCPNATVGFWPSATPDPPGPRNWGQARCWSALSPAAANTPRARNAIDPFMSSSSVWDATFSESVSAEDLDGEPTRSTEIERPGPVKSSRRWHVEPVLLQALVDLVDPGLALLHEADVEAGGILDLGPLTILYQRQHQPAVVGQHGNAVIASRDSPQPEVFFKELSGLCNVRDREIEMVQFHAHAPWGDLFDEEEGIAAA